MADLISRIADDIDHIGRIELFHPDRDIFVHIQVHIDEGIKSIVTYWGKRTTVHEWITTEVMLVQNIDDRTTWNGKGRRDAEAYIVKWDHPLNTLPAKLAAYLRSGYQIVRVRRRKHEQ